MIACSTRLSFKCVVIGKVLPVEKVSVISHDDLMMGHSKRGLLFLDSYFDLDETFLPEQEHEVRSPSSESLHLEADAWVSRHLSKNIVSTLSDSR